MRVNPNETLLAEYSALETRVLAAMREDLSEAEFGALALAVFAFQRSWNEPLAKWCATLPEVRDWRAIPAVPQGMFKSHRVSCFAPEQTGKIFRTSGTTGEGKGEHHLRDTRLYEASLLAGWRRLRLARVRTIFLTPRPENAHDSSLAHMMGTLARTEVSGAQFALRRDGTFDLLSMAIEFRSEQPLAICGTALGFLHLTEQLGDWHGHLPAGSYVVETGGFKGSGRDISKAELYGKITEQFGIAPDAIWNEYGMCELASQFYTHGLGRVHTCGPWMRALVIDPETGEEAGIGETGVLRIFDLANLSSSLAIQTADLAVRREGGFELIGRDPAALPRGCSRQADEAYRGTVQKEAAPLFKTITPTETTAARAAALAEASSAFPFLGVVSAEGLLALVAAELGHAEALDRFVPYAAHHARALAPATLLHVLSGNTPAAALQTLIRGLLLGSHNRCKLPSAGLPEVAQFLATLPPWLAARVECSHTLPEHWLADSDAVIVFGSDETISTLRARTQRPFIAHGHKISIALVLDDPDFASVPGAARDASLFDQQGCLSPHVFYLRENATLTLRAYAERLAAAMAIFESAHPRAALTASEANSIRTLRAETTFRAANGEPLALFASESTAWTVIADATPGFPSSPLNRVVFVKPLPATIPPHLSTCGIYPSTPEAAALAASLGAARICPIGQMQSPPLTWHHDGQPVLAPLVRWVDWER